MEAQRDAGRQVNTRDRLGGEVLGGEDDQVGCAAVGIVDEGHEVAVVFGGVRRGRGEHGLAHSGVAAELVRLHGAVVQVVLEDRVGERVVGEVAGGRDGTGDLADDRAVAVAVRPGDDPVVDPGEFLPAIVQSLLGDRAGGRVDGPPVQGHRAVRSPQRGDVEPLVVLAQVDQDPAVGVLIGVEAVEHPARLDLDPADGRAAVAGQQADSRLVGGVPHVRQFLALGDRVQAERDRQVQQDHVVGGEREVMHHRPVGDRDVGGADDLAARADDNVLHVVPGPEVRDRVQLAGGVVDLGVRGEAARQGPAEVTRAGGV